MGDIAATTKNEVEPGKDNRSWLSRMRAWYQGSEAVKGYTLALSDACGDVVQLCAYHLDSWSQ